MKIDTKIVHLVSGRIGTVIGHAKIGKKSEYVRIIWEDSTYPSAVIRVSDVRPLPPEEEK